MLAVFFFSSRRRHTRYIGDWSSDVCSSDLSRQSELCVQGSPSWPLGSHTFVRKLQNPDWQGELLRSEERRVGKSVELGGRRIRKQKNIESRHGHSASYLPG